MLAYLQMDTSLSDSFNLKSTFGWARMEVCGAFCSVVALASLSFTTLAECLQTLVHSEHLDLMHNIQYITVLAGVHFVFYVPVFCLVGGEHT